MTIQIAAKICDLIDDGVHWCSYAVVQTVQFDAHQAGPVEAAGKWSPVTHHIHQNTFGQHCILVFRICHHKNGMKRNTDMTETDSRAYIVIIQMIIIIITNNTQLYHTLFIHTSPNLLQTQSNSSLFEAYRVQQFFIIYCRQLIKTVRCSRLR